MSFAPDCNTVEQFLKKKMSMPYSTSSFLQPLAFFCTVSALFVYGCCQEPPATDPAEVAALNAIFQSWSIMAHQSWNISGEPCSGTARDPTSMSDNKINPIISCDCGYNNGTLCHIKQLKVYALSVQGPIPKELRNLTFLNSLNLDQNLLHGPLPTFVGEFSDMQYLSLGINSLSGTIPKEIGNLKKLISLAISTNNFSGSLPLEIGNLINLQQLWMDSSGVGGEIPSTFIHLQNLNTLWAADNHLTGKLPDFIGDLKSLTVLRLQGNSFHGPIPSRFGNLTQLTDLCIGDLMNGTSSLDFIRNMKKLSKLTLRNSKIAGTIPSNIGEFSSLILLDLSFNSLTGQIPDSLFNLVLLSTLILANNSISGNLPGQKNAKLVYIDLSYNNLSGRFPSWVNETKLRLNLVANNFHFDNSDDSILPYGLRCLQKDIPCNQGSPKWSSFAIDCGSSLSITSNEGILYDKDDEDLRMTPYYVTSSTRWGVSNVGQFLDSPNGTYTTTVLSQYLNTVDPDLFTTTRFSPSSLRYYGLGLENGNYTVKLQFVETAFPNLPTWQRLGRRIFDIYIQGRLQYKDFDIRKDAGGISFSVVEKEYFANVTNNFLEIHLFWAGKGTCCIPNQGYYGPAISAIGVNPNFVSTVHIQLSTTKKSNKALVAGVLAGIFTLGALLFSALYVWRKKKMSHNLGDDEELLGLAVKPDFFSYTDLRTATEDFHPKNKLGEGGFGTVFKGKLSDGRLVAVKQLYVSSRQGKRQFVTEVATISAVQHRNLVKLYGCCFEGDNRLLVYEFLENGSLDQALFGNDLHLDWRSRFQICLSTAKGLAYLHEESSVRIVHRDIKASNILLDGDLHPKISDFGLAKLYDDKKTHISTGIAGTVGYLAPEYMFRGYLTEKVDIFGFGVVALEILSGRPNTVTDMVASQEIYLLEWAWHLYEKKSELEMVDPNLTSFNKDEATRMFKVALMCTQASPAARPPMSRVVNMLSGDVEVTEVASRPSYLTDWHFKDISCNFTSDDLPSMEDPIVGLFPSHSSCEPTPGCSIEEGRR